MFFVVFFVVATPSVPLSGAVWFTWPAETVWGSSRPTCSLFLRHSSPLSFELQHLSNERLYITFLDEQVIRRAKEAKSRKKAVLLFCLYLIFVYFRGCVVFAVIFVSYHLSRCLDAQLTTTLFIGGLSLSVAVWIFECLPLSLTLSLRYCRCMRTMCICRLLFLFIYQPI